MRKKILAMLLAAVMVMALLPTAFAEPPSSAEEAISYIGWDRSENDEVDYYVEEPITLSEFGGSRSVNGYNVLLQETQLTVSNLADAEDDCYIRVDLLMYNKGTDGNYWVLPANFYLTSEGTFKQLIMSDDYDNDGLKLRPGESVTFNLSLLGADDGCIFQLTATLVYSDYEQSWWMRRYFIVDNEAADRLRQEQTATEPAEPTEPTENTCGENVTWTYSDGVLTIEGTGPMYDYDNYEEYTPWWDFCEQIQTIKIGNGVTTIGGSAFEGCTNLTDVTIPASVTIIEFGAFVYCESLTEVTIPDGVTDIGWGAFIGCASLTSVTIPASVAYIGPGAFEDCPNLAVVYYGGSAAQWDEITIADDNNALTDADIHYSSEPTEPETPEITFNDVPADSWYASAVSFAVEHSLLEGDGKGNFNPNGNLTRDQTFAVLARLDGKLITGDNWSEIATQWAMTNNVSTGENPSADVTREQLVVMLWRYKGEPGADTSKLSGYPDRAYLHDWGVTAMAWAVNTGIIEGSDGWLNPLGTATRAEAVTMIQRYCGN